MTPAQFRERYGDAFVPTEAEAIREAAGVSVPGYNVIVREDGERGWFLMLDISEPSWPGFGEPNVCTPIWCQSYE